MNRHQKINDNIFMLECLTLAEKGRGNVSPNPMVGCVIVKNNKVICRGYHKKFGGAHAEVNAINSTKKSVKYATLYVNLEPCNYYGKTPPCTDLIISKGISEVVIGSLDPNPLVSGKGVKQLRKAGIKVRYNILQDECKKLNESFSKYISTGLPFVTLKIAQTLDGKIADVNMKSKWISNDQSRRLVHKFRAEYDAIMVGAGTINRDNPWLTVRHAKGTNPTRIVLDGAFSVNTNSKIFSNNDCRRILFVSHKSTRNRLSKKNKLLKNGVEIIELDNCKNNILPLNDVLRIIGSKGISSVLVEGGAEVFSSFIENKLADKLLLFIAPKIFGKGLDAFSNLAEIDSKNFISLKDISSWKIDNDILIEGYF